LKKILSVVWTAVKGLWVLAVSVGVIAGLHADLPGLWETVKQPVVWGIVTRVISVILWLVVAYPDGVALAILFAAAIWWWFVIEPKRREKRFFDKLRVKIARQHGRRPTRSAQSKRVKQQKRKRR